MMKIRSLAPETKNLLEACEYGHVNIVKLLLEHPDIDPGKSKTSNLCTFLINLHIFGEDKRKIRDYS